MSYGGGTAAADRRPGNYLVFNSTGKKNRSVMQIMLRCTGFSDYYIYYNATYPFYS